jgi:hypothetical protein
MLKKLKITDMQQPRTQGFMGAEIKPWVRVWILDIGYEVGGWFRVSVKHFVDFDLIDPK